MVSILAGTATFLGVEGAEAIAELRAVLTQPEYEIGFGNENHANPRVESPEYYTLYLYPSVSNERKHTPALLKDMSLLYRGYRYILCVVKNGVLKGYEGGSFKLRSHKAGNWNKVNKL